MLHIQTFDNRAGGNVLYKALAHPLAAEAIDRLYARLARSGPVALYDPDGIADPLFALYPNVPQLAGLYVHDVTAVGSRRAGHAARPLTELPQSGARVVLIAAFDAARIAARIADLVPPGADVVTLDDAKLPPDLVTNRARYLDKLNFATNFAFFRDADGMSTRLVSANYWAGYGGGAILLWLRLFDTAGRVLATWQQEVPAGPCGFSVDSGTVRQRFGLPAFTGQLFVHAIGAAGHDVVKYALDTYASDNGASLSCTHDANAWPSDRYAGLPAPRADERVTLWLQNSHAVAIPAGAISLDRMGAEQPVALAQDVGPFATVAVDVARLLPDLRWPAQIELRAGRHVVRPRYEVARDDRVRIAHVNVERSDLRPDPAIPGLPPQLGRGYLLPFPVLPRERFRSIVQPTPMAERQATLPVRLDVFDTAGRKVAERFLGCLGRDHDVALDLDDVAVAAGHAELVYDFRDGGEADGWLHALFRYEDRQSGHVAESSFGAHVFNTLMTYKDEPQSYSGPPPGLTTRLFLKLGDARRRSFAVLIYPASASWHAQSATALLLHDAAGEVIAEQHVAIACSGSAMVWPHTVFGEAALRQAGPDGYVLVRDTTCRLFGYHGLMDDAGGFSLDHMFGF
ncbi:MAG TPA: hypothetical protein VHT74_13790 [Acetobacteraceae bacterium]|jgi:hypothetical protein|nr:hypothetical protein [Acetobacteraceae bacterium]